MLKNPCLTGFGDGAEKDMLWMVRGKGKLKNITGEKSHSLRGGLDLGAARGRGKGKGDGLSVPGYTSS